jgi:protocatechuate 3,4-dioxygenase beta subunit
MLLSRRQFLRVSATGGAIASLAACGGSDPGPGAPDAAAGGADARIGPDADPACVATRGDAMGPFYVPGAPVRMVIAGPEEPGERLVLTGLILGSDCTTPLAGATVDVWQADREGDYHDAGEGYRLRGVTMTDASGMFLIETIVPGRYVQGTGPRPAHVHFTFTHPDHRTLTTQIYFAGDPYLAPEDSCTSCGSDDDERIVERTGNSVDGWAGSFEIRLAAG